MFYKNKPIKENSFREVFKKSNSLLNNEEKNKLKFNILISFCAGLLEIISATTFYPLVSIIIEPEIKERNNFINYIWTILGFPNQKDFVIILSLIISSILIISTIFNLFSQISAVKEASNSQERLSKELYKNILNSPYTWHLKNNPNVIRNIFLNNLQLWNKNIIRVIPLISGQISGVLFALIFLIIATPKLGLLLVFITGSLLTILLKFIRKKSTRLMAQVREKEELINIFITETLTGIKDIKLSSRKNDFSKIFFKLNHTIIKNYASASNWNLFPTFLVLLFGQLIILITASTLFLIGIEGGELAAIMAIIVIIFSKIIPQLNRLGSSLNNIANMNKWINKIYQVKETIDLENLEPDEDTYSINTKTKWHKVIFSKVKFIYPETNNFVFKNLNFEIKKGLHYAFVGFSGAGKTTAIDLFLGLIKPSSGEILIDGNNLKSFGLRNWQNKISYVPQDPLISYLSLRENIAFGVPREKIDNKKVISCLKKVNLFKLSNSLTKGIFTNLGNQGVALSGGQKQRVAIARALYKNVEILVLDEATSALDNESEKVIQKTIKNLKNDMTIISIAHRFSTIKNCDCIFLLENGKVRDQGKYEELLQKSSLFNKLANDKKFIT